MGARIFTDHQIHKAVQNKMDKVRFCTRNYSIVLKIQIQIIFSSVDTVLIFSFPPFWSPSFPPFITYHFADWGCGWLPICNSYHFKAFFLMPAAKSCSHRAEPATSNDHLFTALTHFLPPISLSSCCFFCFSSIRPLLIFFPFSTPSPYFIFMLSNCLLWKLMQHPPLHSLKP